LVVGLANELTVAKILLVDDEPDLVDILAFLVAQAGYAPIPVRDAAAALEALDREPPDLAVIDINLQKPGEGFDVLASLRLKHDIPVILLTARNSDDDKVRGLELGADDYVVKPLSHRELIARVRAHLRHRRSHDDRSRDTVLTIGPLTMNVREHHVVNNGRPVALTATEFKLLHFLMSHKTGTVVPSRALARHVWGYDDAAAKEVIRVTLHRLRRKLEDDGDNPRLVHTVPGVGVSLRPELN
jgi:two-component system response regulator VicR